MAEEEANKTLFQLKDKETSDDIEYDASQATNDEYVAMTTKKEIVSWWFYDFANSPTAGIGLAFLFPIFLNTLATRYSCLNNTEYGCDHNNDPINSDYTLRVSMGSWQLKPESDASSMISISSALQATTYIAFSALADYGSYKKYLFRIVALFAIVMQQCWVFFGSEDLYLFAGI